MKTTNADASTEVHWILTLCNQLPVILLSNFIYRHAEFVSRQEEEKIQTGVGLTK